MPYVNDEIRDQGLDWATANGTRVDICSTDPGSTYATVAANTLGNDTVTVGAAEDGATEGRRVVIPSITAGTVTASDTATHWALTNGSDTVLASGALSAPVAVTTPGTFELSAVSITIGASEASAGTGALLLETGDYLLLETGDKLLLEA